MLGPVQSLMLMALLGSLSPSLPEDFSDERKEAIRRLQEAQLLRRQDPKLQARLKKSFVPEPNYPIFNVSNNVTSSDVPQLGIDNYNSRNYVPKGREARNTKSMGPDDDVKIQTDGRQARIVDYTRDDKYSHHRVRDDSLRISESHQDNDGWEGQEMVRYSPNRLPASVRREPWAHPDGDVLTGRRELPLDDPVGLHAQRQEIQARDNRQGQSSIVGYLSRFIHRKPKEKHQPRRVSEYQLMSDYKRDSDSSSILVNPPEKPTVAMGVATIIKALLSSK